MLPLTILDQGAPAGANQIWVPQGRADGRQKSPCCSAPPAPSRLPRLPACEVGGSVDMQVEVKAGEQPKDSIFQQVGIRLVHLASPWQLVTGHTLGGTLFSSTALEALERGRQASTALGRREKGNEQLPVAIFRSQSMARPGDSLFGSNSPEEVKEELVAGGRSVSLGRQSTVRIVVRRVR